MRVASFRRLNHHAAGHCAPRRSPGRVAHKTAGSSSRPVVNNADEWAKFRLCGALGRIMRGVAHNRTDTNALAFLGVLRGVSIRVCVERHSA